MFKKKKFIFTHPDVPNEKIIKAKDELIAWKKMRKFIIKHNSFVNGFLYYEESINDIMEKISCKEK